MQLLTLWNSVLQASLHFYFRNSLAPCTLNFSFLNFSILSFFVQIFWVTKWLLITSILVTITNVDNIVAICCRKQIGTYVTTNTYITLYFMSNIMLSDNNFESLVSLGQRVNTIFKLFLSTHTHTHTHTHTDVYKRQVLLSIISRFIWQHVWFRCCNVLQTFRCLKWWSKKGGITFSLHTCKRSLTFIEYRIFSFVWEGLDFLPTGVARQLLFL